MKDFDPAKAVAKHTGTRASSWEFMEGPVSGVGSEFWLFHTKDNREAYVCLDQDHVTVEVHEPGD